MRLLGAEGGSIGAVTFARFYALHVLLLPPLTMLLMAAHIYLVRKHGVAPEPDEKLPKKKFFPEQVFRDTVAIFLAFTVLVILAVLVKVPLGRLADPTDTTYVPRPEWYFLFLFQTLKFFEGSLEVIGSVVLPTIAILLLFLVPFIDRAPLQRIWDRKAALGVFLAAVVGWSALTAAAVRSTPPSTELAEAEGPQTWQQLSPEELAGIGYFRKENCASCHPPGKQGVGPDLTKRSINKSAAWMIEHFKRPQELVPGSSMPAIQLSDSQLNALAAFLLKLNPTNIDALLSAPAFAVEGALVYQQNRCGACHQVNGAGIKLGPPLNGLASRRSREWVEEHFRDPQKLSPGTTMPAYRFNARDMERITSWLLSLPR
jgi:ubiquinol-cytochrome c reductase cytochrome b subunit